MNKQKDRLVELIGSKVCEEYSPNCDEYEPHTCEKCYANFCKVGDLADAILADGWMRPPCKVGDVVYRIVEMSTGVNKVFKRALCPPYTCETIINCKPTIKRFIRSVVVTKNNFLDVVENWGKTVFPTKEEAEAKLKEGVQG